MTAVELRGVHVYLKKYLSYESVFLFQTHTHIPGIHYSTVAVLVPRLFFVAVSYVGCPVQK